jgi:uncharacterized protein related to proFAR isomerase
MSEPALLEPKVSKEKPKRDDRAVKIARDLAVMMNFIVDAGSTEYESVAEFLSAIARPAVEREYKKALEHFNRRQPRKEGGSQ